MKTQRTSYNTINQLVSMGSPMQNRLGFGTQPAEGETVTIGADVFEFRNSSPPLGGTAGRIWVYRGLNVTAAKTNLVSAINRIVDVNTVTRTAQSATAGTNTEGYKALSSGTSIMVYTYSYTLSQVTATETITNFSETLGAVADVWDQATSYGGEMSTRAIKFSRCSALVTAAMIAKGNIKIFPNLTTTVGCIVFDEQRQMDEAYTIDGDGAIVITCAGGPSPNIQVNDRLDLLIWGE